MAKFVFKKPNNFVCKNVTFSPGFPEIFSEIGATKLQNFS